MSKLCFVKFRRDVSPKVVEYIKEFAASRKIKFSVDSTGYSILWRSDEKKITSMVELSDMKCWPGLWSNIIDIEASF